MRFGGPTRWQAVERAAKAPLIMTAPAQLAGGSLTRRSPATGSYDLADRKTPAAAVVLVRELTPVALPPSALGRVEAMLLQSLAEFPEANGLGSSIVASTPEAREPAEELYAAAAPADGAGGARRCSRGRRPHCSTASER